MNNFDEIIYQTESTNQQIRLELDREYHALRVSKELCGSPHKDGDQWCFLFGEDIQEGVAGFGRSVIEAAHNFYDELGDQSWVNMKKL
jgi:hypothetical protein